MLLQSVIHYQMKRNECKIHTYLFQNKQKKRKHFEKKDKMVKSLQLRTQKHFVGELDCFGSDNQSIAEKQRLTIQIQYYYEI